MANSIQESINNAISTIVNKRIDALALDKTVIGVIDSIVSTERHIYKIKCDGGFFNAKSQSENAIYLPGMAVYVQIPQNDMTKDKLIISRATTTRDEVRTDVTVSAINNFSIIGTNLLQKNSNKTISDSGLGIRSYHDYEIETAETISHRVQSLYGENSFYNLLDEDIFNLYKKDATAIMVEADFRTSLDEHQKRQTAGVYGIGLDLKFKNANFDIGETQGEIFNYYSRLVHGEITTIDSSGQSASLGNRTVEEYSDQLYLDIQDSETSIGSLQQDGGLLDKYKSYISSIIQVFEVSGETKDINGSWSESLNTYLLLLDDLKYIDFAAIDVTKTAKENMKNYYDEWWNLKIASAEFNNVAFILDSNNMTGNPYNYSEWSTQYAIFSVDTETLAGINDILFYKDGFITNEDKCTHDNTGENNPREDIFIKNVKIYVLKPISAENGDYRLEINSPDGLVFDSLDDGNTLDVVAKVSKAYYQNLSEQSNFYWFKKNKNVTTVSSTEYHQYGGIGWAYLPNKGNRKRITLVDSENQAYENIYKCVSVTDDVVILAQEFYVYNLAASAKLKIHSDLGVNFSFDSGMPTLTCLINENEFEDADPADETYHYSWAIVVNGQRVFLDGQLKTIADNTTSISDIMGMLSFNNLIKDVKFYYHEEELTENFERATRIRYPINNIGISEKFATFECYVEKKYNNKYIDIGCASLNVTNLGEATSTGYHIVIENGDQIFQYDEYGNPPNAKKLKDPLQIKPLICHFFNPTGIEIPSGNYTLNWIVPITDSMLVPENLDRLIVNPANQLREIDNISREFVFNIAEFYNEDCQNNQITCQVVFRGETITKDSNLLFTKVGENGTNGTDVVARILPTVNNSILDKEPLTLYRANISEENGAEKLILNDGNTSTNGIIQLAIRSLKEHLYLKNEEITNGVQTTWNVAGATKVTMNDKGQNIEVENSGGTLTWKEDYNTAAKYLSNYILRAKLTYTEKDYYAFYPLCIVNYTGNFPGVNRISIDKKFLLKEIMYNADGRNPIYNHYQGVKINNIPKNGRITWEVCGGSLNNSSETADIRLLVNADDKKNEAKTSITTTENVNMIYILPNDEYNGSNCNNRVIATVKNNANIVIATVIVPIYMHLNTFGLASLNAWDGNTVTIDDDGGYVMAPQVGAGEKDENNRFTGILMGKTETSTGHGETEKQVGLFGYAHGLQSIFLDSETGEATFGLPDGYRLTKDGNTLVPDTGDNYSEGRIELKPGDVSSIGGWKIGRRSLFYATAGTTKTIDNKQYTKGMVLPTLDSGNESTHEKDIGHQDAGILLSANNIYKDGTETITGNNPYISLKGRPLKVWNGSGTKPADIDIDNSTGNSPLVNGDSLELQLDPNQSSIFTIYRHYIDGNTWKRSPLVGINAEGRFYSNALQDEETSLNLSYVAAFGEGVVKQKYTGVYIGAESRTFFKAFVDRTEDYERDPSPLRIAGNVYDDEYHRPITLHGRDISLYANDNDIGHKISEQTNSKLIINHNGFIAGNFEKNPIPKINEDGEEEEDFDNAIDFASIRLINSTLPENNSQIIVPNNFILKTKNNTNSLGNISLITKDGNDTSTYSYLTLARTGAADLQGWTNLNGYAQNGNVSLYARTNGTNDSYLVLAKNGGNSNNTILHAYKNIIIDAADDGTVNINNKAENKLLIASTYTTLQRDAVRTYGGYNELCSRLHLSDGLTNDSGGTTYLDAINRLGIRSIGNSWIVSKGDQISITVGMDGNPKSSLVLNTSSGWNGSTTPASDVYFFKVDNTRLGGIQYKSDVKQGYSAKYKTDLGANYKLNSAALMGTSASSGGVNGGLYFNWGWFPGRIFADDAHTGNTNYVNTSIYANYRIVSNTGLRTTQDSKSITMKSHTITSASKTSGNQTITLSITADNAYDFWKKILDELAYVKAYSQDIWVNYVSRLGTAAYTNTSAYRSSSWMPNYSDVGAASSSHTHSLPSNHMKSGAGGPYVTVNGTAYYLTNWQYTYNESTGGPQ